jgi:hypothetical protein
LLRLHDSPQLVLDLDRAQEKSGINILSPSHGDRTKTVLYALQNHLL